ncbi:unnamed protein product [Musa hybrid cultivar]
MAILSASCLLFLLSSILFLLTPPSIANDNNIMLTGDVLGPDDELSYLDTTLTMQLDCNLVLYHYKGTPAFDSGTYDRGLVNCSVALNEHGQFVISDPNGNTIWVSGSPGRKGTYAAVLQPDKQVGIYGPVVWSTSDLGSTKYAMVDDEDEAIPTVKNTLFSSEIIADGAELTTRDYRFIMDESCSLELRKSDLYIWVSGTVGRGQHCFLRLNRRGQLTIKDDMYKTIWSTDPSPDGVGDYVLILQYNGQAAVYGPLIWSTSDDGQIIYPAVSPAPTY